MQAETEELEARRAVAKLRLAEAEKKRNDLDEDQVSERPLIEKKGLRSQPLLPSSELLPLRFRSHLPADSRSALDGHASEYPRNSISNYGQPRSFCPGDPHALTAQVSPSTHIRQYQQNSRLRPPPSISGRYRFLLSAGLSGTNQPFS